MPEARKKVIPNIIVLELTEYEASELAGYLDQSDMHLGVHDRLRIARALRLALRE